MLYGLIVIPPPGLQVSFDKLYDRSKNKQQVASLILRVFDGHQGEHH